jgi:hypothetical protein
MNFINTCTALEHWYNGTGGNPCILSELLLYILLGDGAVYDYKNQ